MEEVRGANTWTEELASLVEDTGIHYAGEPEISARPRKSVRDEPELEKENLKDQVTAFLKSWGEMLLELVLSFNTNQDNSVPPVKKVCIHPPSASRILLPDGRHLAYHELGVQAGRARYSLIAPHSFLSSRLAGIPGVRTSLLEDFGVRLVTFDLPGFGESDPHPSRNLNSSALDMLHLANAVGVSDKFWVVGYSSGSMHAWAALRYIPDRVAGAAMFAPMINPYEPSMTKEEMRRTWEEWLPRRRFMYFLARRFPKLLSFSYRRSFLSGKHGRIDKWMSLSLKKKDEVLIEDPIFEEYWHRDVEESIRQGNTKPFIEEAVLQVSNWGFRLADLQVRKECQRRGFLPWLRAMYSQEECELAGFLDPIHIWQGMDDQVVPPSITDYISRVLPAAVVHKLPYEGHFSYFFFCDDCHLQIFSTLFGSPQGPLEQKTEMVETPSEGDNGKGIQCYQFIQ
ncbi:AB hydrolase-1 domain-containing protein [Citrus sinensis]|uniref:AB hydrolase-1 domain-containing protein n=1 Tax=Citrus sinensis TaxID=2711 RepID=A0ACB8JUK3_CITSI|nr:AB hydrolase-1 domain-containing protein [Citrus sinensis]